MRHKLNKFQIFDAQKWNNKFLNREGVDIKSSSHYLVWPPASSNATVHLIFMDLESFALS